MSIREVQKIGRSIITAMVVVILTLYIMPVYANEPTIPVALITPFPEEQMIVETSPVITLNYQSTSSLEEERTCQARLIQQAELNRLQSEINNFHCNPNDVRQITGLSVENLRLLTEGTWLEGREETLYDLEHIYGINACFAMAVSSLESGCGTSCRARNRNSFYGESTGKAYSGHYENTMYFGDFITRLYTNVGKISVYSIGPKYCPPNRQWEQYMSDYMNTKYIKTKQKLQQKYENVFQQQQNLDNLPVV